MSDIKKVVDHVTFLHMDSTRHKHTHDDKIEFTAGHQIPRLQQFLMWCLNKQFMCWVDIEILAK